VESDVTLIVSQTESSFLHMLTQDEVDVRTATVLQVWAAYKKFARIDVSDCPQLELLVEWAVYDFHLGRDTFQLGFVRHFSIEEDGEYAGMEQLHCISFFEPTPELKSLRGNMWSFNYPDVDTFFTEVEHRDAFKLVSALYAPIDVRVMQWEV